MTELHCNPAESHTVLTNVMEKPHIDNRGYRVIKLPNQLEIMLIHDSNADTASASMDVNVGSFSDPNDLPGIAHAVEHFLFMGTEKYPQENDYSKYIRRYGGSFNAFTDTTNTNFWFELMAKSSSIDASTDIDPKNVEMDEKKSPLYGALDRFAQFFVRPLFAEDSLDRELRAVDSEYKKNLQSEAWRIKQLSRSLANPEHPYHKFPDGNCETLRDAPLRKEIVIRDKVMDFYRSEYSANRMKLVVLGRESLDVLETWVLELFKDVPNYDLLGQRWDYPAYSEKELATITFARPIKNLRYLDVTFNYPDEETQWETRPGRYICHLIGHQGAGSIIAHLKAKGWANTLGAHMCTTNPGTSLLSVTLELTEDGPQRYQDIIKLIFRYIAMLKSKGPREWIFEEIKQITDMEFNFESKLDGSEATSHLSGVMQQDLPRNKLLSARIRTFDRSAISKALEDLRPDNMRITVVSQRGSEKWQSKEIWCGIEYTSEKIPVELNAELREISKQSITTQDIAHHGMELHLPRQNIFIPTMFEVQGPQTKKPAARPLRIQDDSKIRAWWKEDDQYELPRSNVKLLLRSPVLDTSPQNHLSVYVIQRLVQESLAELAYDAKLAGLYYGIIVHSTSMEIVVHGNNENLRTLLAKVLTALRDLQVSDGHFTVAKDCLARILDDLEYDQPFKQVERHSRSLVSTSIPTASELLEKLSPLKVVDVQDVLQRLLSQLNLEILAHGKLELEDAHNLISVVKEIFTHSCPFPKELWAIRKYRLLPPGSDLTLAQLLQPSDVVNHCVDYVLYTHLTKDYSSRAQLSLFCHMVQNPIFNSLRTKEQLGYIVYSGEVEEHSIAGFRIQIQSKFDTTHLESRIQAFLTDYKSRLDQIDGNTFASFRDGLINKRRKKFNNLNQESDYLWKQIRDGSYDFDLNFVLVEHDVEHISKLTLGDIQSFFKIYIDPASTSRRKASVHLVAQTSSSRKDGDSLTTDTNKSGRIEVVRIPEAVLPTIDLQEHVEE